MDAKSLSKVVLLGGSMIAGSLEGAFCWKCSFGHEHEKNETCEETGERYCGLCTRAHLGFEVCSQSIFRFPSEGINYVILPSSVPDRAIAALQKKYGYSIDDEKKDDIDLSLTDEKYEINRLSCCVEALSKKFSPKKVEDKKEVNENSESDAEDSEWNLSDVSHGSEELMRQKVESSLQKKRKLIREDYKMLRRHMFGKESKKGKKLKRGIKEGE